MEVAGLSIIISGYSFIEHVALRSHETRRLSVTHVTGSCRHLVKNEQMAVFRSHDTRDDRRAGESVICSG
jgi:site-specific recombinase